MNVVGYSIKEQIAVITINRPEKRNALNQEVVQGLKAAFKTAATDQQVRAIILKGAGNTFCSGADLKYIQDLQNYSHEENVKDSSELMELFKQIYTTPKPVIAEVHGAALAGGCGLVSVCDFAFCTTESRFGYTEVRIGFIPAIVMVFLIRKIGEAKAKRFLLSGEIFDCETAKKAGLIFDCFEEDDELEDFVMEFSRNLCQQNSSAAMAMTKDLLIRIQDQPMDQALQTAMVYNAEARKTNDCKKGISAFLNKEKPVW